MAAPVVVNGDTSLILINSRDLTANQSAVVLLSSISYSGRTVTIRDSAGFLSSPQSIVVSTQTGVLFADGVSSIKITQPYGYLTVTSRDPSSWALKNSFGFPQNQTIANALSLTVGSIASSNLHARNFVSTPFINLTTINATSTAAIYGPTFASSLLVGPPLTTLQTDPGFGLYIQGTTKVTGNLDVDGTLRTTGNISTASNLFLQGSISTLGNFGARGDIMTLGGFFAPFGSVIASNLDVRGTTILGGTATFSNSLIIGSSLSVQNSISTVYITTSTLQVTSSITMQEKSIVYRGQDLLFSAPLSAPSLSTQNITASNGVQTSNLTVFTSIQAQQVPYMTLSSTAIANPFGSLTISSIAGNSATFSNSMTTSQFAASSIIASTIQLSGNIYAPAGGYMGIYAVVTSSISTGTLYADTVLATNFTTTNLSLSRLQVASQFIADNVSSFSASNVYIDNTGGTISTGSLYINSLIATSSITNTSGEFTTTSGNIRFVASNVVMDNTTISTLNASTITASTVTASRITVGAPPSATGNGPIFLRDTTLYPASNTVVTGGPGDFLTPFLVSNVKPPGIGTGVPYTVQASFTLDFNGPVLPGYYASILGLNLYPNGETNSEISIRAYNSATNIITLYGLFGPIQSYSTPSGTGGIPISYSSPLPSSFIQVVGTMYGNSAFSLQFQSRSNDNFSGIDSNNTVTFNNGALNWPYYLNGTTIQNSLNDMSVRSLYYYGALNFASDPALKEHIQSADLQQCYSAVHDLPLRRYKYKDFYMSAFHQRDVHRLGFLATELEEIFPKSITYTKLQEIPGFDSTIRMIDTQQIEMAHIGATKVLMEKMTSLEATVEATKQEISTLKNLVIG
jgi:hypothetical protein